MGPIQTPNVSLEIDIPGSSRLSSGHAVLDFNGTLAVDGRSYLRQAPGCGDWPSWSP